MSQGTVASGSCSSSSSCRPGRGGHTCCASTVLIVCKRPQNAMSHSLAAAVAVRLEPLPKTDPDPDPHHDTSTDTGRRNSASARLPSSPTAGRLANERPANPIGRPDQWAYSSISFASSSALSSSLRPIALPVARPNWKPCRADVRTMIIKFVRVAAAASPVAASLNKDPLRYLHLGLSSLSGPLARPGPRLAIPSPSSQLTAHFCATARYSTDVIGGRLVPTAASGAASLPRSGLDL